MPTTHNNHTRAEITALAETLIAKLSEAINTMTPAELIGDRNALKLITGALRELSELTESAEEGEAAKSPAASAVTVAFLGEAEALSE